MTVCNVSVVAHNDKATGNYHTVLGFPSLQTIFNLLELIFLFFLPENVLLHRLVLI